MKNSRTIPCRLRAVFIALIFSAALLLRGTEPAKAVISTSTVNVGTHSVTIQRVVPPASDAAAAAAPVASIGNRSSGSPQGSASSGAVVAGQ